MNPNKSSRRNFMPGKEEFEIWLEHQDLPESQNPKPVRMTKAVWGLNWEEQLPLLLDDHIRVRFVSATEGLAHFNKYNEEIYRTTESAGRFKHEASDPARRRYFEALGDFFLVENTAEGEVVGLGVGSFTDWSTYNFRNMGIRPQYRGRGLYFKFFQFLVKTLKAHGVKKIEGDVSPTNRRHIDILTKMGYTITSMGVSERWGCLLKVVYFIDQYDERRFAELFSSTDASDLSLNKHHKKIA